MTTEKKIKNSSNDKIKKTWTSNEKIQKTIPWKKSWKVTSNKNKKTITINKETLEQSFSKEPITWNLALEAFSGFSVKKIAALEEQAKKTIPARILFVFFFSIVFLSFALYKIAINGKGNLKQLQEQQTNNTTSGIITPEIKWEQHTELLIEGNEISNIWLENNRENSDPELGKYEQKKLEDVAVIEQFYSHFGNVDISEMDKIVDSGLKNTAIWKQFRSEKNITTFIKNIKGSLILEDLFFIPGSNDENKKTRQYSYELSYYLGENRHFIEERIITLRDTTQGTKVAAIRCETRKCSSSPFFRPQNYGL